MEHNLWIRIVMLFMHANRQDFKKMGEVACSYDRNQVIIGDLVFILFSRVIDTISLMSYRSQ